MPGTYWNEAIETMSPGEMRRLETERLAEQIDYNYATSPFYRAKLDSAGVSPEEIRDRRGSRPHPLHGEERNRGFAG